MWYWIVLDFKNISKFMNFTEFVTSRYWSLNLRYAPWSGLDFRVIGLLFRVTVEDQWRRQGGRREASPYGWTVDVQKLCNMCVFSLSWNFFVSHDKYIAKPSSKEPRWYTDNTTGTGGLRTLDPHFPLLQNPGGATVEDIRVRVSIWVT